MGCFPGDVGVGGGRIEWLIEFYFLFFNIFVSLTFLCLLCLIVFVNCVALSQVDGIFPSVFR